MDPRMQTTTAGYMFQLMLLRTSVNDAPGCGMLPKRAGKGKRLMLPAPRPTNRTPCRLEYHGRLDL